MKKFLSLCLAVVSVANVTGYATGPVIGNNQDSKPSICEKDTGKSGLSFGKKVGIGVGVVTLAGVSLLKYWHDCECERYDTLSSLKHKFYNFYKWYYLVDRDKDQHGEEVYREIQSKLDNAFFEVLHELGDGFGAGLWFRGQINNIGSWDYWHLTEANWEPGFDIRESCEWMPLYRLQRLSFALDKQINILSHIAVPDAMPVRAE